MTEISRILRINQDPAKQPQAFLSQLNQQLALIADTLDKIQGHRGEPTFYADVNLGSNQIRFDNSPAIRTDDTGDVQVYSETKDAWFTVLTLGDVDRLTSDNSTLILSDDGTNQLLTGDIGDLQLWPDGYFGYKDQYRFPATIGSSGQSLRSPSSGTILEWVTPLALADVDRLTTQDASPSTLILTDDDTNQTLTGSLGDLFHVSTGGDHFFGDATVQDSSFRRAFDLDFGGLIGVPLPVDGFVMDNASQTLFSGIMDLSGIGGPVEPVLGYWDAGTGGGATPPIQGAQFLLLGHSTAANVFGADRLSLAEDSASGGLVYFSIKPDGGMELGYSASPFFRAYPASRAMSGSVPLVSVSDTWTDPSVAAVGMSLGLTVNPTGTMSTGVKGVEATAIADGTADFDTLEVIGGRFQAQHKSTGDNAQMSGGLFEVAIAAGAGDVDIIQAGAFAINLPAGASGAYPSLAFCALQPGIEHDVTTLTGYEVPPLNSSAVAITNLRGIHIFDPGTHGSSVSYGIDSEWSMRAQDDVAWYFGTDEDGWILSNAAGHLKLGAVTQIDLDQDTDVNGNLDATTFSVAATPGWSGWFDDGVNFRVTVVSGIITAVANSTAGGHNP